MMFSSKTTWLADMRCKCNVATRVLEVGWHASFACLWLWTCCRWTPVAICEAWANQERWCQSTLSVVNLCNFQSLGCPCQSLVKGSVCQSQQSPVSFAFYDLSQIGLVGLLEAWKSKYVVGTFYASRCNGNRALESGKLLIEALRPRKGTTPIRRP